MNKKPYSHYKASGAPWLGEVPEHWEVKRLKMAVHLSDKKVEADEENPLPYIGLENIESWTGKLLPIDPDVVPSGVANSFQEGRTLFCKLRPYLAKACNPDFSGLCSTELLVIEGQDFDRRSLLYWLLADGFVNLVDSSTYGSKMPRANWDFIGNCRLPVPPFSEQTAIADFLDEQTGKIDHLVAKKRELIARLKEKRTALISRTVTRGLPPDAAREFGMEPHTRFKDSGVKWLGEVPEGWGVKKLKFLASNELGAGIQIGPFGGMLTGVVYDEIGEYKVYGQENIIKDDFQRGIRWISHELYSGMGNYHLESGDILFTRKGSIGGCCITGDSIHPGIIDSDTIRLRTRKDMVIPLYLLLSFKFSDYLQSQVQEFKRGAILSGLNTSTIASLVFLLPSIPEQEAVLAFLDRETAKLDRLSEKVAEAIARLQEYRTALITAAVTGKIDVRH
ncbi:MAG: restriction endonuclease subunit S [Nitrospirae bacterium]|nr:restriction endonuclease subunit S [Magnetococcales bacterium]HAT48841.1 hypothetical protein [Alphaproteobacteria bacterium]